MDVYITYCALTVRIQDSEAFRQSGFLVGLGLGLGLGFAGIGLVNITANDSCG